jgi:hypothetical protein
MTLTIRPMPSRVLSIGRADDHVGLVRLIGAIPVEQAPEALSL